MDISLFYQLKDRLYSSAMAGCAVINEDFRLKRAVEAFEPLAKANKVFGRLYNMCSELFTSEAPAPLLADCIALCNALAVTQGTFMDSTQTEESEGVRNAVPCGLRYSELNTSETVTKFFNTLLENAETSPEKLRDPRIINLMLDNIRMENVDFREYAGKYIQFLGTDFIPVLKKSIDMTNPKENGEVVKYIAMVAGDSENNWYLEIAENEDNPEKVRAEAVKSLMYRPDNAEILLEFYRTGKAKIKDAAAFALIKLDVPETETVLKKITSGKFLKKNIELISISTSKIASDSAVQFAEAYCDENKNKKTHSFDFDEILSMLANKPEIDNTLIKFVRSIGDYTNNPQASCAISEMLVQNLANNKGEEFRELIERLYKRMPESFAMAYIFMIMTEDRGVNIADMPELIDRYRYNIIQLASLIRYDSAQECYTLDSKLTYYGYYHKTANPAPLDSDQLNAFIKILADTSYIEAGKSKRKKRTYFNWSMQRVSNYEYTDDCAFHTHNILLNLYTTFAASGDRERIRVILLDFCKEVMKVYPNYNAFTTLCRYDVEYIRENPDLLLNTILFRLENFNSPTNEETFSEVPRDILEIILPQIYNTLTSIDEKRVKTESRLHYQITVIRHIMADNGYNFA